MRRCDSPVARMQLALLQQSSGHLFWRKTRISANTITTALIRMLKQFRSHYDGGCYKTAHFPIPRHDSNWNDWKLSEASQVTSKFWTFCPFWTFSLFCPAKPGSRNFQLLSTFLGYFFDGRIFVLSFLLTWASNPGQVTVKQTWFISTSYVGHSVLVPYHQHIAILKLKKCAKRRWDLKSQIPAVSKTPVSPVVSTRPFRVLVSRRYSSKWYIKYQLVF